MNDVSVSLVRYSRRLKDGTTVPRPTYYMRYTDPTTGKKVTKSTGETEERKARKKAGEWESELPRLPRKCLSQLRPVA
jgi:hypothetical protein